MLSCTSCRLPLSYPSVQ
ncbi:MAG: hypothetical protein EOO03_06350 [Chitinophagaceae bacterium]|nr:MAG: hypothetical protein EOO03_06350 [Chitinophagaceae bacterium]